MPVHSFTLILGTDPSQLETALPDALFEAGCDDALLGVADGIVYLDFDREAPSLREALSSAIRQVESANVRVRRIEPQELVTLSEVARRTQRSPESVRLLAEGKRGKGDFPRPVRGLREGPRLWLWVEVAAWFAQYAQEVLQYLPPRQQQPEKLEAARQELDRSLQELEKARLISAFNAALALRTFAGNGDVARAILQDLPPLGQG
jgi:hypothetical protein